MWIILIALGISFTGTILQCHSEVTLLAYNRALMLMEIVVPLAIMAAICHVFTVDVEAGFMEVLRTYPVNRPLLAIGRLAAGLFYVLISIIPLIMLLTRWTPISITAAWYSFTPPTLFLVGIALLAACMSHNWVVGLVTGALYWLVELTTRGRATKGLFLFPVTMAGVTDSRLVTCRVSVTAVGIVLIIAAILALWYQFKTE
jgi:hypothetical protein